MNHPRLQNFNTTCVLLFSSLIMIGLLVHGTVEVVHAASGTFALTGSLNTARYDHPATLLASGEVLVAGGTDMNANPLASAELYNASSGTWSITGGMTASRGQGFTATLLRNGEVLVAGGYDNGSCLNSAELYNRSTGRWTSTGSMNQPRCSHSATLLPNGNVLVAGGNNSAGNTGTSAELYNPSTGEWRATGSLNTARENGAATLMADGEVLLAGGINFENGVETFLTAAELYNPSCFLYTISTNSWSVTGSLNHPRIDHTSTLLLNGKVLIAGGLDRGLGTGITILGSSELYTP